MLRGILSSSYFVIENFFLIPCESVELAMISILFCRTFVIICVIEFNDNTAGATCGTGNTYPSGAHEFTPGL